MPAEPGLGVPTLYGFMLVLARVSGVFALVPLPGFQSAPKLARIVLSVTITLALFPLWPQIDAARVDGPRLLLWVLPEIAVGVTIGLGVAFILEVFLTGAQILSLNAGFSFAQTIDPTTQTQSGVLVVFAQLAGGMVFLSLGLDREVIRTLAYSLEAHPAGAWITAPAAEAMLRLGGDMLELAVRLAMPAIALLVLADIALGLMGRLNAQLQLMSLAFPIKMTAALVLLGWITVLVPRLLGAYGGTVFGTLRQALRF
ncbi:MAG TPA: flagellar biosynthetic protein FliR [Bryobacteraceae bacterium]|nr:flagellar biosynthetic protein FliR [Bryobacteraceae bacterium]